jgi:hypothetical protein
MTGASLSVVAFKNEEEVELSSAGRMLSQDSGVTIWLESQAAERIKGLVNRKASLMVALQKMEIAVLIVVIIFLLSRWSWRRKGIFGWSVAAHCPCSGAANIIICIATVGAHIRMSLTVIALRTYLL